MRFSSMSLSSRNSQIPKASILLLRHTEIFKIATIIDIKFVCEIISQRLCTLLSPLQSDEGNLLWSHYKIILMERICCRVETTGGKTKIFERNSFELYHRDSIYWKGSIRKNWGTTIIDINKSLPKHLLLQIYIRLTISLHHMKLR